MGHAILQPRVIPVTAGTLWDAASLTKPLVTAALALRFIERGGLALATRVDERLAEAAGSAYGAVTVEELLVHVSGLPAWYPMYVHGASRASYLSTILALPPEYERGTRVVYSCAGYLLLAFLLERTAGATLAVLAAQLLLEPAGLGASEGGFNPSPELRDHAAATEEDNASERRMVAERGLRFDGFRDGPLWGTVNDGNAFHLGGVAGNAGLFATAAALARLAAAWLGAGPAPLLSPQTLSAALRSRTPGLEEERALGWQLATTRDSSAGEALPPEAFGHTGFTGTSLWVDPRRERIYVLCTNRIHPRARPVAMNGVRRDFHALAAVV